MLGKRFITHNTPLAGLKVIERLPVKDNRGFFERVFCSQEFEEISPGFQAVQINHTLTLKKGAVRGLHFQYPPDCEIKLVNCLRGKVFDVAVDLRRNSPTFLQWHAELLSEANFKALLIPEGFAHGFQTLEENCELLYLHSRHYSPNAEGGLSVNDPKLTIHWPLTIQELSDRDANHPLIDKHFQGVSP